MPGQARPGHTTAHKDAPVSNTSKILLLVSSCQMVARMGFFHAMFSYLGHEASIEFSVSV